MSAYGRLLNALNENADAFYPKDYRSRLDFEDVEIRKIIAFRLLVHAEVEEYIEESCRAIANGAWARWQSSAQPTKPLLALVAFSAQHLGLPPGEWQAPQPTQRKLWPDKVTLTNRVNLAISAYNMLLKENHGIKESNLMRVLLPVGVPWSDVPPVLVAQMDSYGASRGAVAHVSFGSVSKSVSPVDEWDSANNLVAQLKDLEAIFELLRNEIT